VKRQIASALRGIGMALLLVACSDGSSGDKETSTGIFVDSPVDGLHFTTSSNSMGGFTSGGGHFECQVGDTVRFFIGTHQIGNPQPCPSEIVTAVSVLGASSVTAPEVVNLAQLLMTLATSVTPTLMTLPQTLPPGFTSSLVPTFTDPNFDTAVVAALPTGTTLVPNEAASTQLQTSLKTLTVIDNGGTVTSTPAGINCSAGVGTCSFVVPTNTVVTLTATGPGFTGFSGGGCSGTGPCVVTMNTDITVTALFPGNPLQITLSILTVGNGIGTITCSTDGGIRFNGCAGQYPTGTTLVLHAVGSSGSTFTGWSNGTGNAIGCSNTLADCSITLTVPSSVTANFVLNPVTPLTPSISPGSM
jgi:hypothetical protein